MKKITFLAWFLLGLGAAMQAQTEQKLESGVRLYNSLRDLRGSETATLADYLKLADESEKLLKSVLQSGTEEEKKTAQYFLTVLSHQRGEIYFLPRFLDKQKGRASILSVEAEFDRLNESVFPFRYVFNTKNYIVKYEDFIGTRQRFYIEMAEFSFNDKNNAGLRKYAQKALALNTVGNEFFLYILHYYLYTIGTNAAEKIPEIRQMISQYSQMSQPYRVDINNQNAGTKVIIEQTNYLLEGKAELATWDPTGAESVSIAADLKKSGDLNNEAARFYERAISKAYNFSFDELWDIVRFYETINYKQAAILQALNRILPKISGSNCVELDKIAGYYTRFGDPAKGQAIAKSAQSCREEAQKQAAAEEKRRRKADKKASRAHAYLGAYVLRVIQRPQYIDIGGVLDIPVGRSMLEFSYMKARNDQDYMLIERLSNKDGVDDIDNPHWDGFYAHFAYKKMQKTYSKSKSYGGFLINYNQRDFQPMLSDVLDPTSGQALAYGVAFEPRQTSYGAMVNFGQMSFGKVFGADMYFGIGATYNQFDLNHMTYNQTDFSFSHPLLAARKETSWGFQMRIGLSVGLSL